eukprot:gene32459-31071_t
MAEFNKQPSSSLRKPQVYGISFLLATSDLVLHACLLSGTTRIRKTLERGLYLMKLATFTPTLEREYPSSIVAPTFTPTLEREHPSSIVAPTQFVPPTFATEQLVPQAARRPERKYGSLSSPEHLRKPNSAELLTRTSRGGRGRTWTKPVNSDSRGRLPTQSRRVLSSTDEYRSLILDGTFVWELYSERIIMAISMQKMGGSLLQSSMLRTMTKANAFTIPASMNDLTDAERHQLAKDLGYTKIGKELPSTVTLNEVVRSMPAEVFEIDHTKAWLSALTSIVSMSASLYLISIAPWYLLPIAWFIAGTAFTGWFVVGHDAGHRSFHKNNLVEDIVGTFFFAPLLFPFEPWRIKHNHHHAHTNKLIEDTAWHPITEDVTKDWNATAAGLFRFFLGTPLKCFASIGHWAIWHFNLGLYKENQKPRVIVSWLACAAFAFTALPALVYYTGWVGLVKFWLMPWLGYHFWMSTFTMIHHTAPHIPFKEAKDWNAAQAQLAGTVHCNFPGWIEFLCHDINVHVPHHVSSKIPWYNLRKATDSLRENWGEYMTECDFNWRIMKNIWLELHLYDEDQNYKSFDFKKPEPFFTLQRKIYPNAV